jgi:four helix bundle protein
MRPYERFRAWELSHALARKVFELTAVWPKREWYGLAAQVRRASVSVPSNLVEGSAKRGRAEFRRFIDISIGSLAETEYQLRLARDLGFVGEVQWNELDGMITEAGKCLHGLARSLRPPDSR